MCYEDVSASAFWVLLRFLFAGALPAWDVGGGGEGGGGGGGPAGGAGGGASRRAVWRSLGGR